MNAFMWSTESTLCPNQLLQTVPELLQKPCTSSSLRQRYDISAFNNIFLLRPRLLELAQPGLSARFLAHICLTCSISLMWGRPAFQRLLICWNALNARMRALLLGFPLRKPGKGKGLTDSPCKRSDASLDGAVDIDRVLTRVMSFSPALYFTTKPTFRVSSACPAERVDIMYVPYCIFTICRRSTRSKDKTFSMFKSKRHAYNAISVRSNTDSSKGIDLIVLGSCGVSNAQPPISSSF